MANKHERGFHFHTGRPLTKILGYKEKWLEGIPESSIESFAGTGNPFSLGEIRPGERVIDTILWWPNDSLDIRFKNNWELYLLLFKVRQLT